MLHFVKHRIVELKVLMVLCPKRSVTIILIPQMTLFPVLFSQVTLRSLTICVAGLVDQTGLISQQCVYLFDFSS